ncbi:PAS domain S-box protein [delta proteobacterium NaphS2]|nr:PAS domain S-box protein [delta proteobacterium NaphS2]
MALQLGGIPIANQFFEHLDLRRNAGNEHRELTVELLRKRYAGREIDLIITLYPEGLDFLLNECETIFPDVPVLALYLPQGFKLKKTERRIVQHLVIPRFKPTIASALKLVPNLKCIYVVGGTYPIDKWLENVFRKELEDWKGRLTVEYLSDLPPEEILSRAAIAPSDSILFITAFGQDINGKPHTAVEVSRMLAPVSSVPIFGFLGTLLGNGIVGGSLLSLESVGIEAGKTALQMLSETPQTGSRLPNVMEVPQLSMFDWGELRRWNLSESALPKDSIIINREFSLWDLRYYAMGALAFIMAQSFLIAGLLWHRRRRKLAEEELKKQLKFEQLLSEISTGFVNLAAEDIDSAIQNAQERFCEVLELDFAALWQVSHENPDFIYLTHFYRHLDGPRLPEKMDAHGYFPWCLKQATAGRVIAVSTETAPPEAARDREMWRRYGIKSSLVFPLSIGGNQLMGALSLNTMQKERTWPEQLVKQLQLLAQVFANAIARKRADYALREMEKSVRKAAEEWQATFDSIPHVIMILDRDLRIVRHNAATVSFLQLPPAEIHGQPCHYLVHGTDGPPVACPVKRSLKMRNHQENEIYDAQRKAWYQVSADSILDEEGEVSRIVHRIKDITERVEAEEKARLQWEELAHVTRIGIMGELTSSLAHEINQPLTAIQSNAAAARRFLSEREPDIVEVRQILDDIISDNTRAGNIIMKIRALLKREQVPFDITEINDLIADVLSLLRADALLPELEITTEFTKGLPHISADRIQLQQVIINLILNGAAAMKDLPSSRREIRIKTAVEENGNVKVLVIDFGTGIEEDAMRQIFEPFYTTKKEGLGMGLPISQTIIEAHGGSMEASNNPEGGTVFSFTLPAYQGGAS